MKIKLKHEEQWILSIYSIIILIIWAAYNNAYNVYPSYVTSTLMIVLLGVFVAKRNGIYSFFFISYLIIFLPSLSPFYANSVRNVELFSLAAADLQTDNYLINKTVFLYTIAAIAYCAIAYPISKKRIGQTHIGAKEKLDRLHLITLALISITLAYIMEPGPTLITSDYTTILNSRYTSTPFFAFTGVLLGGSWAALFAFGRHRSKLFLFTTLIVLSWLFLHSRRVEFLGIFIALVIWLRFFIKSLNLFLIISVIVTATLAIGLLRNYSFIEQIKETKTGSSKIHQKAAIPGGASNVFLSGLHLVNVKDRQILEAAEEFTMAEWPRTTIPNSLFSVFGMRATKTEHQLVFEKLDLQYVGGMPLLAAFYLNGGFLLVIFFGMLHGFLGISVDKIISRDLRYNLKGGGTFALFVAVVFIVYQFRYHWYNPQTLIRAVFYASLMYLALKLFLRKSNTVVAEQQRKEISNK